MNCNLEKMKDVVMCVSCTEKPREMLIQTCKHVPFCYTCDLMWKAKKRESKLDPECPICRKKYIKTTKIQNF